ncbi:MAG: hypothetical protein ACNA8W_23620, partial [Bradymonadaceae bacterium]
IPTPTPINVEATSYHQELSLRDADGGQLLILLTNGEAHWTADRYYREYPEFIVEAGPSSEATSMTEGICMSWPDYCERVYIFHHLIVGDHEAGSQPLVIPPLTSTTVTSPAGGTFRLWHGATYRRIETSGCADLTPPVSSYALVREID